MKNFDADVVKFINVFAEGYYYQIPDYQRPYSWKKEHCRKLLEDLVNAYKDKKDGQSYFCGSLVLLGDKHQQKRYDVIDGQQRLTTLTIMLAVIRDYCKESGITLNAASEGRINAAIHGRTHDEKGNRIRFQTGENMQNIFEQTILLKPIDFNDSKEAQKNRYLRNAHILRESLSSYVDDSYINDFNEFTKWLYEYVEFVVIIVGDLGSGIKIFNVLNATGLKLAPAHIIKSHMMVNQTKEHSNIIANSWNNIYKNVGNDDKELERILNYYTFYREADNLTRGYDEILLKTLGKTRPMKEEVYEIEKFTEAQMEVRKANDAESCSLLHVKWSRAWLPILITAYHVKYHDIKGLLEILTAYYYQNWIAGHTFPKVRHTSISILKAVKNGDDITKIKNEICKIHLEGRYETTQKFRKKLDEDIAGELWIKPIMCMLEYYKNDGEKVFIKLNDNQLEHILPQKLEHDWVNFFDHNTHKSNVNKLGNLTLLSKRKNIQAYNYSFKTKKEVYENSDGKITSFEITKDILKYDTWDQGSIQKRHDELKTQILKRLDIFK